ncbi:MAG: hypothetical protein R3C56_12820 [Pirellulaceae bacterium]
MSDTSDPFGDDAAPAVGDPAPATGEDPFGAPAGSSGDGSSAAAAIHLARPQPSRVDDPFGGNL